MARTKTIKNAPLKNVRNEMLVDSTKRGCINFGDCIVEFNIDINELSCGVQLLKGNTKYSLDGTLQEMEV